MGSVQKLATVVIIGMVAFATLLVLYMANENHRQDAEAANQNKLSIERATTLYVTYCLQCHGPDGLGAAGGDGRIGGILNDEGRTKNGQPAKYQTGNAVTDQAGAAFAHFRIENGVPPDPGATKLMPSFGDELNEQQISDLIYMIGHVDWNYVYNQSVLATGQNVAAATCQKTPTDPVCKDIAAAPPVYPTAPAPPSSSSSSATPAAATPAAGGSSAVTLDAVDIGWDKKELTVKPGDTITVVNKGVLPHDFSVDELKISQPLDPGKTYQITIPKDAKPGKYKYYCNVPGHEAAGMVGTLTVEG